MNGWETVYRQDGTSLLVMWSNGKPKELIGPRPLRGIFPAGCLKCERDHRLLPESTWRPPRRKPGPRDIRTLQTHETRKEGMP